LLEKTRTFHDQRTNQRARLAHKEAAINRRSALRVLKGKMGAGNLPRETDKALIARFSGAGSMFVTMKKANLCDLRDDADRCP